MYLRPFGVLGLLLDHIVEGARVGLIKDRIVNPLLVMIHRNRYDNAPNPPLPVLNRHPEDALVM